MLIDPTGAEPCNRSSVDILGHICRHIKRGVGKWLVSVSSLRFTQISTELLRETSVRYQAYGEAKERIPDTSSPRPAVGLRGDPD